MVLKTRDKLIEVARQLFAQKGEENTTMNDIAVASEKGRRTVYTYFKNKKEILNAVVKAESDKIVEKLIDIPRQPLPPEQKLINFIFIRFDTKKYASYIAAKESEKNDYKLVEYDYFTDTEKLKRGMDRPEFMTLAPNSITKVRVYIWLEGQDVDCINYASHGGGVTVNIGLVKGSGIGTNETDVEDE